MSRGPIPLPDHERQRRNDSSRFRPLGQGVKAPPARGYQNWPAAARHWWRAVKQSRAAAGYDATDWQMVLRAAQLLADAENLRIRGEHGSARLLMSEVRQLEDRLLLSVRARRSARISDEGAASPLVRREGDANYRKLVEQR